MKYDEPWWRTKEMPSCVVDGKPADRKPKKAVFVGMECSPNQEPRYGSPYHPHFNLPCYETKAFSESRR